MKSLTIKKSVVLDCFSLVLYDIIMELYYIYFIVVRYPYYGFDLEFSWSKYIETKFIFLFLLAVSIVISKVSEFMYSVFIFFIVFFVVPGLITYSHSDQIPGPLYSTVILLLFVAATSFFKIQIPSIVGRPLSLGMILLLLLLSLIPIAYQFGMYFNIKNLFLQDVYETRDVFNESTTVFINYLYPWLIKAAVPLLLIFFLIHRRYMYSAICFFILVYLYVISGNKLVYITLFVMLFFYFVGRDYFEKVNYFLLFLVMGLIILPVIDMLILDGTTLKGIFIMRMFFFPSHLNYYYFDFFHKQPLYFAESHFFNLFFDYPYDRAIGYVVSEEYFNAPEMNVNNGIISDGYMNLGYIGVGINILLVSLIFLFFNSIKLDSRYLGIFFLIVFLLLSAPMLSMFITSGLWLIFLMALTIMKVKATSPITN